MKNIIKNKYLLLYSIFFIFIFIKHLPMGYISDDKMNIQYLQDLSIFQFISQRFFENGRFLTDGLAYICYHIPLMIWKIIDSLVYLLLLKLIAYEFTDNSFADTLVVSLTVLLFPFSYLKSAGYIATSTNYIYTLLCMLIAILPIIGYVKYDKKPSFFLYVLITPVIIYLSNQEQYAITLILGLMLYISYCLIQQTNSVTPAIWQKGIKASVYPFILTIISFAVMFAVPGHLRRLSSTSEWEFWLPQYGEWSVFTKIYKGYTSTVANLFYQRQNHILILCLAIASAAFLCRRRLSAASKVISTFPLAALILIKAIGYKAFVKSYDYTNILKEIPNLSNGIMPKITLLLSIMIVLSIFTSVIMIVEDNSKKALILLLLLLAAISREMMGFSGTIYASSNRTFIIFSFFAVISALILANSSEKKDNVYQILIPGLLMLIF